MDIIDRIAKDARTQLGRPARRTVHHDWAAWEAVRDAAHRAGLDAPLLQYVTSDAQSVRAMAAAYVGRYAQAYGPVGGYIDAGAHIGTSRPVFAR